MLLLLLLLSRFSHVRLCVTPHRLPHPRDSPGKNTGVGCHFLLQCMKVKSESEVAQSWADCKSKKLSFWKVSYLILCSSNEAFLDRVVTCDKNWILYHNRPWPAQWLDREEAPKCFPKPNLHQKKSRSLFHGLLPVWSTAAFWIPAKPLHLRCMLSKSMRCTGNCNASSQHWSIARGQFFSRTTPDGMLHNQCLKSWMKWATKFCLIHHIHLTSSTD